MISRGDYYAGFAGTSLQTELKHCQLQAELFRSPKSDQQHDTEMTFSPCLSIR